MNISTKGAALAHAKHFTYEVRATVTAAPHHLDSAMSLYEAIHVDALLSFAR